METFGGTSKGCRGIRLSKVLPGMASHPKDTREDTLEGAETIWEPSLEAASFLPLKGHLGREGNL